MEKKTLQTQDDNLFQNGKKYGPSLFTKSGSS